MTAKEGDEHSSGGNQRPGPPAPVFISYASQDAAAAKSIVESLELHRLTCWMAPRDVKPGTQYADSIVRAINEAGSVVLVLSASAVGSAHVAREVERAASKRKPIIPFRLDAAKLSPELEYFLSNSQWIEVTKLGMPAALARLSEAVGQEAKPVQQSVPRPLAGLGKRVGVAAAGLVAIGVAVWAGLHSWSSTHTSAQSFTVAMVDKSIAVLPFVDMSEKKDQEYFGDGMAEEIIDLLVKSRGLRVIGRTSSFQFKGKTQDLRGIGTQLGVAYVLEGSVRKSGDRLRVTAQLIDSRNGRNVWSQTYDQELSDILRMQDEIAVALVRELKIEVSPLQGLEARPALRNTEAYALYLHGLHDSNPNDQQRFEQARSEFQRALDLDPTFAEAAGMLASTYAWGASVGYIPRDVGFAQARAVAEHAIKLDPKNPIAYSVLGDIDNTFDWDWAAADRDLKRTLDLAPNNPVALQIAARHSLTMGRWDEALNLTTASLALDPLDVGGYYWLSAVQLRRGRLVEAEAAIRRALDFVPTFSFGPYALGVILLVRSQPQSALTAFSKEPIEPARLTGSAMAYFALGRKAESDASLAQMLKDYAYIPFAIATIYAFRGESDQAFKWLDRAYAQRDPLLYRIKFATEFDSLQGDSRYKAFLKNMNLPE